MALAMLCNQTLAKLWFTEQKPVSAQAQHRPQQWQGWQPIEPSRAFAGSNRGLIGPHRGACEAPKPLPVARVDRSVGKEGLPVVIVRLTPAKSLARDGISRFAQDPEGSVVEGG